MLGQDPCVVILVIVGGVVGGRGYHCVWRMSLTATTLFLHHQFVISPTHVFSLYPQGLLLPGRRRERRQPIATMLRHRVSRHRRTARRRRRADGRHLAQRQRKRVR